MLDLISNVQKSIEVQVWLIISFVVIFLLVIWASSFVLLALGFVQYRLERRR